MYLAGLRRAQIERYLANETLIAHTPATLTDPETLLSEIRRIRRQGYALDAAEFMEEMIALAVPVAEPDGRLLATLSLHARFTFPGPPDDLWRNSRIPDEATP